MPTGRQRPMHRPEQARNVIDIVQGKRTVGEIETVLRQAELVEIGHLIGDAGIRTGGTRAGKHLFRQVQPKHLARPVLMEGGQDMLDNGSVVAGNEVIQRALLKTVKKPLPSR